MERFFTSDTHFGHSSILSLGHGRPFDTTEAMNEALIERWNAKVGADDTVYHLGDFSFAPSGVTAGITQRLNGQIVLVKGNHDKVMKRVVNLAPNKFIAVKDYAEVKMNGIRVVMFHFPILSWHQAHRGAWHLHGHCHGNLQWTNGPMHDVGVDVNGFAPLSEEEVINIMSAKPTWIPLDHHDKEVIAKGPAA